MKLYCPVLLYIALVNVVLNNHFASDEINMIRDGLGRVAEVFKDDRMCAYENQHGSAALQRDNQSVPLGAIDAICTQFDPQRKEIFQYDAQGKRRLPPQKNPACVSERAGVVYMERGQA